MFDCLLFALEISETILKVNPGMPLIADIFLRYQNIGTCSISEISKDSTPLDSALVSFTSNALEEKASSKRPLNFSISEKRNVAQAKRSKVTGISQKPKPVSTAQIHTSSNETVIQAKVDVSSLVNTVIRNDGQEKTFQCSFCTYNSTYISAVKRHIEIKHMPSKVLFPCQTCEKTFKMKQDLKRHYVNVHKMPEPAAKAMIQC